MRLSSGIIRKPEPGSFVNTPCLAVTTNFESRRQVREYEARQWLIGLIEGVEPLESIREIVDKCGECNPQLLFHSPGTVANPFVRNTSVQFSNGNRLGALLSPDTSIVKSGA